MARRGSRTDGPGRLASGRALVGVALLCTLAACGGDGSTALKAAEAKVVAKEAALAEANVALTNSAAEFCGASETYVRGLDRYGDVLVQTATTVGDVKDAGAELAAPRQATLDSAEAAVAAQQAVVQAEQELAQAKADLKARQTSSTPSPVPSSTSAAPLAPERSVSRVRQAEAEFRAAQEAVTDDTPLAAASQQFNATVVALEMSWLRLFADAGCLTGDEQKQAEKAVRDYTTTLQRSLRDAGYFDAEVDGVYDSATVKAVQQLQESHGLRVTGTMDKATTTALQGDLAAKGGAAAAQSVATTAAVQQTLKLAGFWDGPVDGTWTAALTQALQKFQTELGVKPTGTVDAATVAALEKSLAEAGSAPSPAATDRDTSSSSPRPSDDASTGGGPSPS